MSDVTSQTLRQWRESKGWDVPRMARELRKAARDTGEDVAAHHGLVKMIRSGNEATASPASGTGCCTLRSLKTSRAACRPAWQPERNS